MSTPLDQLLALARQGTPVVIYDSVSGTTYTLSASRSGMGTMPSPVSPTPVTPVENIQELTEEQLLAKINRDVAMWRAGQSERPTATDDLPAPPMAGQVPPMAGPVSNPAGMADYQFESLDDNGLME